MPKLILAFAPLLIFISGYIIGFIQVGAEHVSNNFSQQAGVLAFIILMIDKLLSFILNFKKDKIEEHLEVIRVESVKQTSALKSLGNDIAKDSSVLVEANENIKIAMNRQVDIYNKFLTKPKRRK